MMLLKEDNHEQAKSHEYTVSAQDAAERELDAKRIEAERMLQESRLETAQAPPPAA